MNFLNRTLPLLFLLALHYASFLPLSADAKPNKCARFYSISAKPFSATAQSELAQLKHALDQLGPVESPSSIFQTVNVPFLKKGNWVQMTEHITESYENVEYGKIVGFQKIDQAYQIEIKFQGQYENRKHFIIVDRTGKDDWHKYTFKRLDDSQPGKLSFLRTLAVTNIPEKLKGAWATAILARINQGKNISFEDQSLSQTMKNWTQYSNKLKTSATIGSKQSPVKLIHKLGGAGGSEVYEVVHKDEIFYFRPNHNSNQNVVRKTWLAYLLSQNFATGSVPECSWVQIHGRLEDGTYTEMKGTLSRKVLGKTQEIELGSLDHSAESVSSSEGFEFMIGNTDLSWHNFSYFKRGNKVRLEVFDHGAAFSLGLSYQANYFDNKVYFALTPPRNYSQKFVSSVMSYTASDLVRDYQSLLSPSELDSILFRREIVLVDVLSRFPHLINQPQ